MMTQRHDLSCLVLDDHFKIIGMDGAQVQIHLTRRLVREALNLPSRELIDFFKLKHSEDDNKVCSDSGKLVWDELNR